MKDLKWIKKSKSLLGLIAINLAIAFLALEGVSLAFYLIKEQKFYYTRGKAKAQIVQDLERTGIRVNESIVERLHPFFGYVLKQNAFTQEQLNLKVNRHGFFSRYDYPFIKTNPNQYIIAVLGGSVANNFALDEYTNQRFSQKLKSFPAFANKEIIILNFGNGGYKQPQQLLILNYFLSLGQELDMVINIDGFNEVALSNLNNKAQVDVTMPSVQHIQPLTGLTNNSLSPEMMSLIVNIQQTKKELKAAIDRLQDCKLALCYSLTSFQVQQLANRYQQEVTTYDAQAKAKDGATEEKNIVYIPNTKTILNDAEAFNKIASAWYESSLIINQVLSNRKIPYFHFIQPNQYYPTQRVFTEEEKRIAISKDSPYPEGVRKGYPVLLKKAEDLRKAKVNIFNGVNILDDVKETVYKDGCCHYNAKGDEILASFVSNSIIQTLKTSK